ncbi:uncharacterized protein LOC142986178 [Anticarsia gemmatalis]|uniref:uncharacterized protein LOC142986178 n=1 Tax=Anticarsia gemmatalis TaxID=129554 RepID=UPI003F75CF6C
MDRVAWLTCALLALASARIYDRCQLARDLKAFGVNHDHISTWVCIAYHESRFDTNARNHYSGDHGIFQISELYWCGPGKACGLSCDALRDDDISNDMRCALQVHEEHTRIQGNGFLAWVVYPQHCKHNTKKYLADCNISGRSRVFAQEPRYFPSEYNNTQNVEELLPPYLAIANLFRGNYGKVLGRADDRVDWYNYKISNIDDLKLPNFDKPSQRITEPSTTAITTTTQTTTAVYIPPVMPWRRIETNQFRKKQLFDNKSIEKPNTEREYVTITRNHIKNTQAASTYPPTTHTSTEQPATTTTTTTTHAPRSVSTIRTTTTTSTTPAPPSSTTSITWRPITTSTTVTPTTIKPVSPTTILPYTFTTRKPYATPPARDGRTKTRATVTTPNTTTEATTITTTKWTTAKLSRRWPTPKPTAATFTTSTPNATGTTTTLSTTTTLPSTTKRFETTQASTRKPKTDISWYTFTSRTATTAVTKLLSAFRTTTARPFNDTTTTRKPKATQSIFDLYLNPTKPPKLPAYSFDSAPESRYRLKIFSGGTTTPAPTHRAPTKKQHDHAGDAVRNHIKRQNDAQY